MTFRELRRSVAQTCITALGIVGLFLYEHFRDILFFAGTILVTVGIGMWSSPLAIVVLGLELIGFAVLTGKR